MLGLLIVSLPFLIAALQKKILWRVFISWTLTSIFATLSFLFGRSAIEKYFDPKMKLWVLFGIGILCICVGLYMRRVQSATVRNIGWIFVIFGFGWVMMSIPAQL